MLKLASKLHHHRLIMELKAIYTALTEKFAEQALAEFAVGAVPLASFCRRGEPVLGCSTVPWVLLGEWVAGRGFCPWRLDHCRWEVARGGPAAPISLGGAPG
ncbi:hypothetical protein QZH56_36345 [Streptomyces olivoreticuli]|uniref:hypothetical protein n=1 Tax=Streptomyces olivoreticuli TaxID=68246 RepID=UPI00265A7F7D|nr:hypothetical protein [Streptomyces olivoreticuli]WKK24074.1 hypothetical protein QZH56_36345 [Streptomyces olivoreticuli]